MSMHNTKKGFTLVEMIVAMAIFSIVSLAAIGALIVMTGSGQKVQATRAVADNISFIMEDIVREARLAVNHRCTTTHTNPNSTNSDDVGGGLRLMKPQSCVTGGKVLAFNRLEAGQPGQIVEYQLDGNIIKKRVGGSGDFQEMSLSNINVLQLNFRTSEALLGDGQISLVTIQIEATINQDEADETKYNIQSSVYPRYSEYDRP